jgi:hypothetical protein
MYNKLIFLFLFFSFACNVIAENNNSDSFNQFEASLMKELISESNPVNQIRDKIVDALKNKDSTNINLYLKDLESYKTRSFMPIRDIEKEYIFIELKMYRELLKLRLNAFKTLYDSTEYDDRVKIASDDPLMFIVSKHHKEKKSYVNYYDIFHKDIMNSSLTQVEKDELAILLLLDDAYISVHKWSTLLFRVEKFISDYPNHEDVPWIQKSILTPLQKR